MSQPNAICSCGKPIYVENESHKVLYRSRGKMICAVCRVLRKAPKKLLEARKQTATDTQEQENKRVMGVGADSQQGRKAQEVSLDKMENYERKRFSI